MAISEPDTRINLGEARKKAVRGPAWRELRRRFRPGAGVLAVLVFLPQATFAQDEALKSPGELREAIASSFVVRSRQFFYPAGVESAIENTGTPLPKSAEKELRKLSESLLARLAQQYERRRGALEVCLGVSLPGKVRAQLVFDQGLAGARIQRVSGGRVELSVSPKLLAAIYRGSLTAGAGALRAVAPDLPAADKTTTPGEREALQALEAIEAYARQRKPGGEPTDWGALPDAPLAVMELLSNRNTDDIVKLLAPAEKRFALIDQASAIGLVDRQFFGTILFVVAHELGHEALGTIDAPAGATDEWKREAELNADRFATLLLSENYLYLGVRRLPLNYSVNLITGRAQDSGQAFYFLDASRAESCLGYAVFFGQAYELTYSAVKGAAHDWYPDAETRRLAAEEMFVYACAYFSPSVMKEVKNRTKWSRLFRNGSFLLLDALIK